MEDRAVVLIEVTYVAHVHNVSPDIFVDSLERNDDVL